MTTPGLIPTVAVAGVPAQPLPYGLLSVAVEQTRTDPHTRLGVEYETDTGLAGLGVQGINCSAAATPMVPEDLANQWPTVITKPVLYYAGVKGKYVGRPGSELQDRARRKLARGLPYFLERTLWSNTVDAAQLMSGSTAVLNGGAATDPDAALGFLEQWIADNVGALGTIHTSRYGASVFAKHTETSGSKKLTKLGTPVAFGGGYRNTDKTGAAASGTAVWIVATGPVSVTRGGVILSPTDPDDALNTMTNDAALFALEVASVGYEGGAAAILVSVEN